MSRWGVMIYLKSPEEIEQIREASRILLDTFRIVEKHLRPGIKTIELDRIIDKYICSQGAKPSFKGFQGYPASSCISIDEQVVHGIPGQQRIEEGQIVGIDVGVEYRGYFSDAAKTYAIGQVSQLKKKLMQVTREALYAGIAQAKYGNRLSDISHTIQEYVERFGFSVVRELVGHGVGRDVWEQPQIPNYGPPGKGPKLKEGMVLAIEPMVNAGGLEVYTDTDNWTVVTADGQPSAHFEHTIAILRNHTEILTNGLF